MTYGLIRPRLFNSQFLLYLVTHRLGSGSATLNLSELISAQAIQYSVGFWHISAPSYLLFIAMTPVGAIEYSHSLVHR